MKSFCIDIAKLFNLNSGLIDESNFDQNKKRISIPKYQREYKWKNEKIVSLIADIKEKSKFLGIVIVDETNTGYEIVDGQQRITTFMLILAALYNFYNGHRREQDSIKSILKPGGSFLFSNDTVGSFLSENGDSFSVNIEGDDIYEQSDDFTRAFDVISKEIEGFSNLEEARNFKQKLLDCKILVLINDVHEFESPVEQLFLDINEKSQKLDVEDVFKGHCFENFDDDYHEELKNKWVEFKKAAMEYRDLGFEDVSEFIYLYLLEMKDKGLPKDLTVAGRHYLEGKTMDETEELLDNMIEYGKEGIKFCSNIDKQDYRFVDLCSDSRSHSNTDDHIALKKMCKEMLKESGTAIYQKIPLLTFLYYLSKNPELSTQITHVQLRKIVTNLYVYMTLFVISGQRKSKDIIDQTLRVAMESDNPISNVVEATKLLRKEKVESFNMLQNNTGKKLEFVCSVIDNYSANDGWLKMVYGKENNHNIEHFIIMKNKKVEWVDGEIHIKIADLPREFLNENIKKATNFLIIDKDLNESLESKDIITKIHLIDEWYSSRHQSIPKHVSMYINYIISMPSYNELLHLRGTHPTTETIKEKYMAFLQEYFDDNNFTLLNSLKTAFATAFNN